MFQLIKLYTLPIKLPINHRSADWPIDKIKNVSKKLTSNFSCSYSDVSFCQLYIHLSLVETNSFNFIPSFNRSGIMSQRTVGRASILYHPAFITIFFILSKYEQMRDFLIRHGTPRSMYRRAIPKGRVSSSWVNFVTSFQLVLEALGNSTPDILRSVLLNTTVRRGYLCLENNGPLFEQYLLFMYNCK